MKKIAREDQASSKEEKRGALHYASHAFLVMVFCIPSIPVHGDYLYWADNRDSFNRIFRLDIDSPNLVPELIFERRPGLRTSITTLYIDHASHKLYFGYDVNIWRSDPNGGNAEIFLPGVARAIGIDNVRGHFYYADELEVVRTNLDGTGAFTVFTAGANVGAPIQDFAVSELSGDFFVTVEKGGLFKKPRSMPLERSLQDREGPFDLDDGDRTLFFFDTNGFYETETDEIALAFTSVEGPSLSGAFGNDPFGNRLFFGQGSEGVAILDYRANEIGRIDIDLRQTEEWVFYRIPEPASIALLATTLSFLVCCRRTKVD